jgi:hypothetical protein
MTGEAAVRFSAELLGGVAGLRTVLFETPYSVFEFVQLTTDAVESAEDRSCVVLAVVGVGIADEGTALTGGDHQTLAPQDADGFGHCVRRGVVDVGQLAGGVELPAGRELSGKDLPAEQVGELFVRLAEVVGSNRHRQKTTD